MPNQPGFMNREQFSAYAERVAQYLAEGLELEDAIDRAGEEHWAAFNPPPLSAIEARRALERARVIPAIHRGRKT